MRQGQGSKRSRGRGGGRRNAPQRNQNFDSNGPSIRIRGNANQVYEKYLQLARDANTAGDRVAAENMYQHAEHYFRVLGIEERESQARLQNRNNGEDGQPAQPAQHGRGNGADHRQPERQPRHEARPRVENSSESDGDPATGGEQPTRQHAEAESTRGDAPGEDDAAPRRPQRRSRRNNGRATPPDRDTVDATADAKPSAPADASDAPAVEREPEPAAPSADKESVD